MRLRFQQTFWTINRITVKKNYQLTREKNVFLEAKDRFHRAKFQGLLDKYLFEVNLSLCALLKWTDVFLSKSPREMLREQ